MTDVIIESAPARIALLGNPSDEYYGKTISCTISNFCATVTLAPARTIRIQPNPLCDLVEFDSCLDLHNRVKEIGYYGGLRIIWAMCNALFKHCEKGGIRLERKGFTITYTTSIPRQVGMGGSTAIAVAALRSLMRHYDVEERQIPLHVQANLVGSVGNEELGFSAGLQDEVAQVYGGLTYMDFDRTLMESRGYGEYERIDPGLLPPLYLAYAPCGREEGALHANVRRRWTSNDKLVVQSMAEIAMCAKEGRQALIRGDKKTLSELMDRNFDCRRAVYGDILLGQTLEMALLARRLGLSANSTGSGGSISGVCDEEEMFDRAVNIFREHGFAFVRVQTGESPRQYSRR